MYRGGKWRGNYVAIEHKVCTLCDQTYATDTVMLDMRTRRVMNQGDHHFELEGRLPDEPVTGRGVCDTCKRDFSGMKDLSQYDHACLVGIDPDRSVMGKGDAVTGGDTIYRTGAVAFVKRSVWQRIFNVDFPEEGLAFVDDAVIDYVSQLPGAENVDD